MVAHDESQKSSAGKPEARLLRCKLSQCPDLELRTSQRQFPHTQQPNLRSVVIGCLASVTFVVRLQFGARFLHAELVGSGSWLDCGGRVSGSLLGLSDCFH